MATITTDDNSWYQQCRKLFSSVWIFISSSIISAASVFLLHVCKKSSDMELPVASTPRLSQLMGDNACPLSAGFPRTSRTGRNSLDSHLQRDLDKSVNTIEDVDDVPDDPPANEGDDESSVVSAPYITSSTSCDNTTITASISWESHSVYSSPPPSVILCTPIITITAPAGVTDEEADTASSYNDALDEAASEPVEEEEDGNIDHPAEEVEPSCQPPLGNLAQRRGFHGGPIITSFSKPQVLLSPSISCWSPHSRRSSGSIPHKTPRTALLSPDAIYNARHFAESSSSADSDYNHRLKTPATSEPTPPVTFHEALLDVTAGLCLTDFDLDEFTSFIDNLSVVRESPCLPPVTNSPDTPMNMLQEADSAAACRSFQTPDCRLPQPAENPSHEQHNDTSADDLSFSIDFTSQADRKAHEGRERRFLLPVNSNHSAPGVKPTFDTVSANSDLLASPRSAFSSTSPESLQHLALTSSASPSATAGELGSSDFRAGSQLPRHIPGAREKLTGFGTRIQLIRDRDQRVRDDAKAARAKQTSKTEGTESLTAPAVSFGKVFPLLERSLENTDMSHLERHNAIKSWISLVNSSVGTNIARGRGNKRKRLGLHGDAHPNSDSALTLTQVPLAAKDASERDRLALVAPLITTRARSASLKQLNRLPSTQTRFSLVRRQSSLDNISARARAVALERHHAPVVHGTRRRFSDPSVQRSPLKPLMLPIRLAMRESNVVSGTTAVTNTAEGDTGSSVVATSQSLRSAAVIPQRTSVMSEALLAEIMSALNVSEYSYSDSGNSSCSDTDLKVNNGNTEKVIVAKYTISYGVAF